MSLIYVPRLSWESGEKTLTAGVETLSRPKQMSISQLPEYLQFHGQSRDTGRLAVQSVEKSGYIYLLDGEVVYAEAGSNNGMLALFSCMVWPDSAVRWEPRQVAPKVMFHLSIDELLFQFAQIEDSNQTDEASLAALFAESDQDSGVKLMDLSRYDVSFEVLNTSFKGFEFVLEKENTLVGRIEDCDVILPEGSVSSHHCRFSLEEHCVRVIDLGSTNGTFINGELVSDHLLQVGDRFQIGSVALAMHLKMRRKLNPEPALANMANASPPPRPEHQVPSQGYQTQKLDPKVLHSKTSRVSGPITWKNLVQDAKTKTKNPNSSLFGKMFWKK